MRVILEVLQGPRKGRTFVFDHETRFVVGRSRYVHCSVPEDSALSRDHFVLEVRPPLCDLQDLGSANGTFVNNIRVEQLRLHPGDRISAGACVFLMRTDDRDPPAPAAQPAHSVVSEPEPVPNPKREGIACRSCGTFAPKGIDVVRGSDGIPGGGDPVAWMCERCRQAATAALPSAPGYDLVRQLGRGSMGVVYQAHRQATGESVALKWIIPEVAAARSAVDRFQRELEILRSLRHRNIVRLLDHGQDQGQIWFAMEYVDGPNLEEWSLARAADGPYPIDRACRMAVQMLQGLEHAHAMGIVHRDLKPENILVGVGPQGGRMVKISDFGLAKHYRRAGLGGLTFSGEMRGTLHFMPPEQMIDFRAVRPTGDLYAAAATLYFLITGRYPYDPPSTGSEAEMGLIQLLMEHPPVPLLERRPDVPQGLAAVIDRALSRKPEDRFPNAREFRKALRPFSDGGS